MENEPEVLHDEISIEGYILFELKADDSFGKLAEIMRTKDIAQVTARADNLCRAWPGIKFYVYSGITDKWYAYYKPIQGV